MHGTIGTGGRGSRNVFMHTCPENSILSSIVSFDDGIGLNFLDLSSCLKRLDYHVRYKSSGNTGSETNDQLRNNIDNNQQ